MTTSCFQRVDRKAILPPLSPATGHRWPRLPAVWCLSSRDPAPPSFAVVTPHTLEVSTLATLSLGPVSLNNTEQVGRLNVCDWAHFRKPGNGRGLRYAVSGPGLDTTGTALKTRSQGPVLAMWAENLGELLSAFVEGVEPRICYTGEEGTRFWVRHAAAEEAWGAVRWSETLG